MSKTKLSFPGCDRELKLLGFARRYLHRKQGLRQPRNLDGPDLLRIVCGAEPPFLGGRADPANQTAHADFSRTGILPVPVKLIHRGMPSRTI